MSDEKPAILMQRRGAFLMACSAADAEFVEELPQGKELRVRVTQPKSPRSLRQHRLFFAMLTLVVDNLDQPLSKEALLEWVKLKLGHVEMIRLRNGEIVEVPKSISFDAMEQAEFHKFFQAAVDLICEHIIPGLNKPALIGEAREMLGEPVHPAEREMERG